MGPTPPHSQLLVDPLTTVLDISCYRPNDIVRFHTMVSNLIVILMVSLSILYIKEKIPHTGDKESLDRCG